MNQYPWVKYLWCFKIEAGPGLKLWIGLGDGGVPPVYTGFLQIGYRRKSYPDCSRCHGTGLVRAWWSIRRQGCQDCDSYGYRLRP